VILLGIYVVLIGFFIRYNNFFGILKDEILNRSFYLNAFVIKISGLVIFYLVYTKLYGTVFYSDTNDYYHDSKIIYSIADWNFTEFIKVMFGVQNDAADTELFQKYLRFTTVWDESEDEFLYNDNRLMLRFHAIIHFFSLGNYYVHAFVCSFMGFLGINWIYKAFKHLFKGKEVLLFSVWLLFPGLWFWSSTFLKEGPALFLMGLFLVASHRILIVKNRSLKNIFMFSLSIILSFMFKQYMALPLCLTTILFFIIQSKFQFTKHTGIIYLLSLFVVVFIANYAIKPLKNKTIVEAIAERQRTFMDVSKGGLFLLDSTKFIRLPYDTALITKTNKIVNDTVFVRIKTGASYSYWEHQHQQDTLHCKSNKDTTSLYKLFYVIKKSKATLQVPLQNGTLKEFVKALPYALFISIGKPFFFDARNAMDVMTSIENLLILLTMLLIIVLVWKYKSYSPWITYFFSIVVLVLLAIGLTSPNLGAIQRYRVLAIPFLFMCALFLYRGNLSKRGAKFFKNPPNN